MSPKELNAKLEVAAANLPGIERKRMPGGYALFAGGKIFANITVEGRIGVKLTAPWCFEDLAALPGAGPWQLGKKIMEHWVLIPESLYGSDAALREWVERAHGCAMGSIPQTRPDRVDASPPTTRSANGSFAPNGSLSARNPASSGPDLSRIRPPTVVEASVLETPPLPPSFAPAPRRRSFAPAPPSSSRNGVDLSSYAPPPPSQVGIRVVPKDSKSPYEETLVGVPAPSSTELEKIEAETLAREQKKGGD